jgi:4-carboxymuconolactone decarboxylase
VDNDLFEKGLERRKATLGKEYVEKNLEAADELTRDFQEAMTAWCWRFGWSDDTIDAKTRSMMNLTMIGALDKMHEWEIHCRGALTNGVTKERYGQSCTLSEFTVGCRRRLPASAWPAKYWSPRDSLSANNLSACARHSANDCKVPCNFC